MGEAQWLEEMTTDEIVFTTTPDVRLIEHSGGDESVVSAMLVSTKPGTTDGDFEPSAMAGRINFLMKNKHGTPFEHNQFRFFVRASIFVFREFHRHRIGWSYNEESGRYKQLDPKFYIPGVERPLKQEGKPGAYTMVSAPELHAVACEELTASYIQAYHAYERMLEAGVAKEVARMCLPVGINSSMYATCNARSLMAFLALRTDDPQGAYPSKPQYEIEQVARRLEAFFAEKMPITHVAWVNNGRVAP